MSLIAKDQRNNIYQHSAQLFLLETFQGYLLVQIVLAP